MYKLYFNEQQKLKAMKTNVFTKEEPSSLVSFQLNIEDMNFTKLFFSKKMKILRRNFLRLQL